MKKIFLLIALFVLFGCSMSLAEYNQIEIFSTQQPARKYSELGLISVPDDNDGKNTTKKIKDAVLDMGGDAAIIQSRTNKSSRSWLSFTFSSDRAFVSAVAIKWID